MHVRQEIPFPVLPVPVLRWRSVSPVVTELPVREDLWEVIQAQRFLTATGMRRFLGCRRKRARFRSTPFFIDLLSDFRNSKTPQ